MAQVSNQNPQSPNSANTISAYLRLKEIGSVLLATSYCFGMVCWQVYAWLHRFGSVSALNLQYFASGFGFLIWNTACLFCLIAGLMCAEKTITWTQVQTKNNITQVNELLIDHKIDSDQAAQKIEDATKWWERLRRGVFCVCSVISGLPCLLEICFWKDQNDVAKTVSILCLVLYACFILYWMHAVFANQKSTMFHQAETWRMWGQLLLSKLWAVGSAMALSLILYSIGFYPVMPQELGGGAPKVCYIDIEKGKVSDMIMYELICSHPNPDGCDIKLDIEQIIKLKTGHLMSLKAVAKILHIAVQSPAAKTAQKPLQNQDLNSPHDKEAQLEAICQETDVLEAAINGEMRVWHSQPLDLWFDSSDYMIVRVHDPCPNTANHGFTDSKVIRIPKSLFLSITLHMKPWEERISQAQ